jgi:hypothetical protein
MARRKDPPTVSTIVGSITNLRVGANTAEDKPNTVFIDMSFAAGDKDAANDLLYAACKVANLSGAYGALKDLFADEERIATLVQHHMLRERDRDEAARKAKEASDAARQ